MIKRNTVFKRKKKQISSEKMMLSLADNISTLSNTELKVCESCFKRKNGFDALRMHFSVLFSIF